MIENNVRLHQTTVYIPWDIRSEIRKRGMTVTGAFLAGWEAIQDRQKYAAKIVELETDVAEMRTNIRGYQRMLAELQGRVN